MIRGPGDASGVGAEWVDRPWPLVRALLAVVGVVLLVWVVYLLGPLPLVPVALALMAIVVGWLFMAIRGWDGQRYSLLWMLAIAAERRMPMATSVEAFADQYRGGFRRRVRQLAALLEGGAGLAFALRRVPGLASGETTMMVELGEENDRLGEALRRAADQHLDRSGATRQMTTLAAYLGFLLLFGTGIVFFILYFIVPKFEAIFHDFGIPLPGLTRFVIQAGHFLPSLLLAPLWILALPFQFLAFLLLTQADRYPAWFFAIVFLLYIFAAAAFVLGLLALFRASAVRFPTWSWRTRRAASRAWRSPSKRRCRPPRKPSAAGVSRASCPGTRRVVSTPSPGRSCSTADIGGSVTRVGKPTIRLRVVFDKPDLSMLSIKFPNTAIETCRKAPPQRCVSPTRARA